MEQDQQPKAEGSAINVRLVGGLVAALALVLFVFQNTDDVPVRFLWMEGNFPLFLLLLITVALTLVVSLIATWLLRRRGRG